MADAAFELRGRKVFVAGHRGMVGSAILRRLATEDVEVLTAGRAELDLRDQAAVHAWLADRRPDVVVVAAAKVGGIHANNTYPADFIYENLVMECNLVHGSHLAGVGKLLFLGSSCIYPREAPQPIPETALLTGPLEKTNEWYAVAKIAGIKLCEAYRRQHGADYISAMPCNLYGLNDYYHPENSHVIPALMRRFHEAARRGDDSVVCWGTGAPRREFLNVDDLADACVFLLRHYSDHGHVNVGTGSDITIRQLAELMAEVTGFRGRLDWDTSKPDGTMLKCMDVSLISGLGWKPRIALRDGLMETFEWFLRQDAVRA